MDFDRPWISTVAVAAVAVAALATTWVSTRPLTLESGRPVQPLQMSVVKAPPMAAPTTATLGGPPAWTACAQCGVVEGVRVVDNHAAFVLDVRMADGSLRTLRQATPVATGVTVIVQGGMAQPVPAATRT